jgi:hypothetical protein
VAVLVGRAEVQEGEGAVVRAQVGDRGGGDRGVVLLAQDHPVDALRPRPLEQGELRLRREQRRRLPGDLDPREHRLDRSTCGVLHGRGTTALVVPGDPVPAAAPVDPTTRDHAGVVGQRDRQLDLGAGVERARALVEQAPHVRRARAAQPAQSVGVETVE